MQITKKVRLHKRALFIGALFLYALKERNEEIDGMMEVATEEEASYMLENLNDRLVFIVKDLVDMHGTDKPSHTQSEHLARTAHLIEANPFLQTINHIDPEWRISLVSPFEPNEAVIGLKIEIPAPKEALEKAASSRRPYLSRPFEIIQGNLGYSLMIPHAEGYFFEVVFTAESVFIKDSPFRSRKDIMIQVSDGDTLVFTSPEYDELLSGSIEYKKDGEGVILNRTIHLSAVPTDGLLSKSLQFWQILSVGSLILALSFKGVTIYYFVISSTRTATPRYTFDVIISYFVLCFPLALRLFNNNIDGTGPVSFFTTFPRPAILHIYITRALFQCFKGPNFLTWCSWWRWGLLSGPINLWSSCCNTAGSLI